jgi:cation/acetate symporter
LVARILVIAVAAGAAWLALNVGTAPPALIGWALALAAAGNFAPLLLGIWWRGATPHGALAGMATGVGLLALSLLLPPGNSAGLATGSALAPIQAAAVAIPAALFVTVLVSVVTKRRDERQGAELAELFAVLRGGHRKPPLRERPA